MTHATPPVDHEPDLTQSVAKLVSATASLSGACLGLVLLLASRWGPYVQVAAGAAATLVVVCALEYYTRRRLRDILYRVRHTRQEAHPGSATEDAGTARTGVVTVLALCEVDRLVLHPEQLYRFRVMPGCPYCRYQAVLARVGAPCTSSPS